MGSDFSFRVEGRHDPGILRLSHDRLPLSHDKVIARGPRDRRPTMVIRHIDLGRAPSSLERARLFVHAACTDCRLDMIRNDAVTVASELVTNAVQHAGTACRLALRYRAPGLTVAVYDGSPDRLPALRPFAESQGLPGLIIVSALSLHWGVNRGRDGKCVWAFLPTAPPAAYSRTVRNAAQGAVRTALAHEAASPNVARAVRQLVERLVEEHPQFVRGLADALVAELIDATFAIAAMSEGHERPDERTRPYGRPRTDVDDLGHHDSLNPEHDDRRRQRRK